MASNISKDDDALELMWAAHFNELRDMSDADLLEGVDLPKARTDKIQLMAQVKVEAGKRRMTEAREKLQTPLENPGLVGISLEEARAFLRQASNDSRFTMAARALEEMSDELVLRTYARLKARMEKPELDEG